jgi:uncharacterized protein DUF1565
MPHCPMIETLLARWLLSQTFYVANNGNDGNPGSIDHPFLTIQHALDVAKEPGDTVLVRAGTYHERLTFPHSGSAAGGYITLSSYAGEHVLLSGVGANDDDVGFGENMVQIINQSYVKLVGFEIAYNNGISVQDDAYGVRVQGAGTHVEILHNRVHDMTGEVTSVSGGLNLGYAGAGIHVYGSSLSAAYSDVTIRGNVVYNCQPGDDSTETVTINGNVTHFSIDHNIVHDDNNIGIDMIGGEADVFNQPDGTPGLPVARDGVCADNTVYGIHANYGGGYADAIYVDGGRDITVSDNHVYHSDLGIEVGCENAGYVASGVMVSGNLIDHNTQGGLVFGGYQKSVGRVQSCTFTGNTLYQNDTTSQGNGEVWIQWATGNVVENNTIYSTSQDLLIDSQVNTDNTSNGNTFYCADGQSAAQFIWGGKTYVGFSTYQAKTGQDRTSTFSTTAPGL